MKKISLNIVVALISKIVLIITNIIAQLFILQSFGSEINGLTSSVTQFITYFTLLEAGLGVAAIQAMYKPLFEKKYDIVDGIISATNNQYKKIGGIFFILVIILSLLMPIITNSTLNYFLIFGITLLMGLPSVLNYLFIGKYNTLLQADEKIHVINSLDSILGLCFSILKIIFINLGCSIILVLIIQLLSPIFRIIFLKIYVNKKYPHINFKAIPKTEHISKRWSVLVHQLVGMVVNNTDIAILTFTASLSMVSVYSVYNYIYLNIHNIMQSTLLIASQASFGQLYHSNDKNKFLKYYNLFENFVTYIVFVVISVALLLTIPFVKLYTSGITDINYIDGLLALLFAVSILFSSIRIPPTMMINIAGCFKETQKGAILEAVLNILISIPAYIFLGIKGLLIGTCVSMIYRAIDVFVFSYKNIISKKIKSFFKLIFIYIIFAATFVIAINYLNIINVNNWLDWFIYALIIFILSAFWFFIPLLFYCRKDFNILLEFIKKRK